MIESEARDSRQHQKLTAVSNSLYLIHSLMTAAAVDAFVVQEHQTSVKANPELPTELQVITTLTQQTLTSKYTRLWNDLYCVEWDIKP